MHELEEQAIREESKSHHNFLSACQAILLHAPQPLKENLSTSYHILLGQLPSSLQSAPFARTPQAEEQPSATASPWARTQAVPMAKKVASFTRSMGKHIHGWNFLQGLTGRTIKLQKKRDSQLVCLSKAQFMQRPSAMTPDPMKEARLHYFATHPCDWIHDNTDDLSDIFRELVEGAGLLGESIHEIQLSWDEPEELKHANYAPWSLPKGLRFLRAVPTMESPKVMGLKGIHNPNALWCFTGYTYCPWCGKEGQNEGTVVNHLRTTHYRLGLVCDWCFGCPTVMLGTLCWHGCHSCQK